MNPRNCSIPSHPSCRGRKTVLWTSCLTCPWGICIIYAYTHLFLHLDFLLHMYNHQNPSATISFSLSLFIWIHMLYAFRCHLDFSTWYSFKTSILAPMMPRQPVLGATMGHGLIKSSSNKEVQQEWLWCCCCHVDVKLPQSSVLLFKSQVWLFSFFEIHHPVFLTFAPENSAIGH